ncbi:MAG: RluA family pseudouridine synthase [Bacilli bacterium]|nr:RluA family pseudouridine synthase [Bacilli bacterium]
MINIEQEKIRIDKYLTEKLELSRSKIQRMIEEGKILINGKRISPNYKTKLGDKVEIYNESNSDSLIEKENIPLDIVYEDDDLLLINKESGMVVHPAPGHYKGTLVNALLYRFQLDYTDDIRPGIVHRLDKDTSGVMMVAKNEEMHDTLASMIQDKKVKRSYVALVEGIIPHETGTIDAPIGRDSNNRQKMAVTEVNGKDSITHFRVLERFKNHTFIECILDTGRTHQIRVHLSYIKHPVVNDPIYNKKRATSFGQMLHSKSIEFIHPKTGESIHYEVEPPREFLEKLEEFRNE